MAQIRPEQLERHLASSLAPLYLVAGEEPLVIEESLGRIRRAARNAGFGEREVLHADGNFDWQQLLQARDNLSLFAQRRLIELRLPGSKPGNEGGRVLRSYASSPPDDTLLVVIADRLDANQRSSGWAATLAKAGAMVYAWPVGAHELPQWIGARLRANGVEVSSGAIALLAERSEGNLLAAAQEIDKLVMIHGAGSLDTEAVRAAVVPNQRFDVFDLPEAARGGDRARVLRIAEFLREADEPQTLVLWALARDLRVLVELQAAASRGEKRETVLGRYRIPRPRRDSYTRLAARTSADCWESLLAHASRVDAVIKGVAAGRPWDELIQLADHMARVAAAPHAGVAPNRGR